MEILGRHRRLEDTREMYRCEAMFGRNIVCRDIWETLEVGRYWRDLHA